MMYGEGNVTLARRLEYWEDEALIIFCFFFVFVFVSLAVFWTNFCPWCKQNTNNTTSVYRPLRASGRWKDISNGSSCKMNDKHHFTDTSHFKLPLQVLLPIFIHAIYKSKNNAETCFILSLFCQLEVVMNQLLSRTHIRIKLMCSISDIHGFSSFMGFSLNFQVTRIELVYILHIKFTKF